MNVMSITSTPCQNSGCNGGKIVVYNVYEIGDDGLPVGREEPCDVCEGKGFQVLSLKETPNN